MIDQCLQLLGCVSYACWFFYLLLSFFSTFFFSHLRPRTKSTRVSNTRTCNVQPGLISEPGTDAHSTYSSAIGGLPQLWFCSAAAPFPINCLHPLSADLTCSLVHCLLEAGV